VALAVVVFMETVALLLTQIVGLLIMAAAEAVVFMESAAHL
jgi:hypothetical protein